MSVYKYINRSELGILQEIGKLVIIQCGFKFVNVSINCEVNKVLCLYYILSDFCEYNNIVSSYMDIVIKLVVKIVEYKSIMMVFFGNKLFDLVGNLRVNGGIWRLWLD